MLVEADTNSIEIAMCRPRKALLCRVVIHVRAHWLSSNIIMLVCTAVLSMQRIIIVEFSYIY